MDMDDNTTVFSTLKSFNSFISHPEPPKRHSEHPAGSANLQINYKRSMEVTIRPSIHGMYTIYNLNV